MIELDNPSAPVPRLLDIVVGNGLGSIILLGYFILLTGAEDRVKAVRQCFRKWHRGWQSVMAAEFHAHAHEIKCICVNLIAFKKQMSCRVDVESFVDGRTLLNVIAMNSTKEKQRVLIDICKLKKSRWSCGLKRTGWSQGKDNVTDVLKKELPSYNTAIWKSITNNEMDYKGNRWETK